LPWAKAISSPEKKGEKNRIKKRRDRIIWVRGKMVFAFPEISFKSAINPI
jgi:hypothetical protein